MQKLRALPNIDSHLTGVPPAIIRSRHIGVVVTGISVDAALRVVSVSVAADLSSLIPGILPFEGVYQMTGTAEARMDGR
jgi:hypothetical protein